MSQAIIPLKGSGLPKLTAKTVMRSKFNENTGQTDEIKQNYVDRVRGYIPVEVVAFYVFVNSLISENVSLKPETDDAAIATNLIEKLVTLTPDGYVAIVATIFGLVGTALYIRITTKDEGIEAWKITACIAIAAFLIWIYAMDAKIFDVLEWNVIPSVSGLLLASFTLFIGIIVPTDKVESNNTGTLK